MCLYRTVLQLDIDAVRAKRSQYILTVLSKEEVRAVIQQLSGVYPLVVQLLYGCGFRQIECLRLRVKDIDFAQHQIVIWHTKGIRRQDHDDLTHVLNRGGCGVRGHWICNQLQYF